MKNYFVLIALALIAWGCSKEEFAGTPKTEKYTASPIEVFQNLTCANHTLIKPPVDIVYVVDNSLSQGYLSSVVKEQIRLTVQSISQQFDYRVVVAPLLEDGNSDSFRPVITNNASGLSAANVVSLEGLNFFSTPTGAGEEKGFDRSADIIDANRSNGVLRQNAHTIVVLVSNGDDTETKRYLGGYPQVDTTKYDAAYTRFINLKASLNSQQLRFFSLVAHTAGCKTGYAFGDMYRRMSARLYSAHISTGGANDQSGRSHPDSYDLCASSYGLYAGVNSSIQQEVLGHTYNRWLVSSAINTNVIESVTKISPDGTATTVPLSASNGYTCCEDVAAPSTVPTRELPDLGEYKSGRFINLHGAGKVVYPECLVVKSRTPTEFYGFAVIPSKPKLDTLVVRVRGVNISQGGANGWSFSGYLENQNIKVNATNTGAATPALNRTGYFIKLNGTSFYASGDTIEVYYTPEGI